MENSFAIGDKKFKLRKIDAFKQFHIVRRIAPILADLLPAMKGIQKINGSLTEDEKLEEFAKIAAPLMNGLSKLSDEDANRVLYGLLAAAEIQQTTGNWAAVAIDGALMIQDLELPVLIQVAGRAFMFNLSGFFAALPRQ